MADMRTELDRHLHHQQPRMRTDFCADAPGTCTHVEPDETEESDR